MRKRNCRALTIFSCAVPSFLASQLLGTTLFNSDGFETSGGYVVGDLTGQPSTASANNEWQESGNVNSGGYPYAGVINYTGSTQQLVGVADTNTTYSDYGYWYPETNVAAPFTPVTGVSDVVVVDWTMAVLPGATGNPFFGIQVVNHNTTVALAGIDATTLDVVDDNRGGTNETNTAISANTYYNFQLALNYTTQNYALSINSSVIDTQPFAAGATQFTDADITTYVLGSGTANGDGYFDNYLVTTVASGVWLGGAGNWSDSTKWSDGTVPNNPLSYVQIDAGNPTVSVVTLDQNAAIGSLVLDSEDTLSINSGNTLTIAGPATSTINGKITGSGAVTNNGQISVGNTGSIRISGNLTGTGNTTVQTGSSLTVAHIQQNSLTIDNVGQVQLTGGGTVMASTLNSLNINTLGTLDLTDTSLFINYGSGPDPIASIAAWIKSGYAGGTWLGTGITSTTAQTNSRNYGIGYADSADPGNPANLPSGTIEIKYTLLGDANLDGKVNGSDFTLMAANFNKSVINGWDEGDFDYSGAVNGSDFVLLAANFNQFASQSAVSAADLTALNSFVSQNGISLAEVPEPTCAAMMVVLAVATFHRYRRSGSTIIYG